MDIELNKFEELGTLASVQVDENWQTIIDAFAQILNATPEQIRAMISSSFITPAGIGNALEWVPITYASSVTLNGSEFAQGELTLTGPCELAAPTGFSSGTKYLMVKGADSTPQSLTFDSGVFKGEVPGLNDITDERWYLLSIVARSETHYVASAVRAL